MQVDLAVSWLRVFGCCLMMVMLVRKSSRFLASVNSETVQSARPPKTGLGAKTLISILSHSLSMKPFVPDNGRQTYSN